MITSKLRSIVHVFVAPPERKTQEPSAEYRKFLLKLLYQTKGCRKDTLQKTPTKVVRVVPCCARYVFTLMATTDEEYEAEVAYINENFDEALASPFYAMKINAFRQVAIEVDDYNSTYTCTGAIIFAVAGGVVALALIVFTVSSFVLSKKAKGKA